MDITKKTPAVNERFGASGGVARPKFCGDFQHLRPFERQWNPRLRQAATTLSASVATVQSRKRSKKLKFNNVKIKNG
jgi:hypothetical protein